MTGSSWWPFYPLPSLQNPPFYRPSALARIPIKYYSKLASKEPIIPWIIVTLLDRKLVCRAVPSVSDTVEYVEASSNLWIPEAEETLTESKGDFCVLGELLKKPKYAEAVEVDGDHLDNFISCLRAELVHKPICEGLNFTLTNNEKCASFKVKRIRKDGGGSVLKGEFLLVAPQTTFSLVKSENKEEEASGDIKDSCPPGLEGPFNQISDLIDPKILCKMRKIGVNLPRGVLLSGPPGVGKTFLVSQLSRIFGIPLKVVNGPELISPIPGESERNLLQVFEEAREAARTNSNQKCSIIFFDEIDAIARKREGSDSLESLSEVQLLTQLLVLMDGFEGKSDSGDKEHVIVFAATNRPNSLDPAIRRAGRFDREIIFEPPNAATRSSILKNLLKEFDCSRVDLDEIGRSCVGYVSADLASLVQEVSLLAEELTCLKEHFVKAMKIVGPSLHRQYQVSLDNRVTWNDIAGINEIRNELRRYIEWPLVHADAYERMGLAAPRGVLLYGPPGCSKTTIAKAIANESGFTFYSLNGAALYSCFVGESEQQSKLEFLDLVFTFTFLFCSKRHFSMRKNDRTFGNLF